MKEKSMLMINKDYATFTNNITTGVGWILKNDIARQWSLMFNKRIMNDQFKYVVKVLEENNLIKDEETAEFIDW